MIKGNKPSLKYIHICGCKCLVLRTHPEQINPSIPNIYPYISAIDSLQDRTIDATLFSIDCIYIYIDSRSVITSFNLY